VLLTLGSNDAAREIPPEEVEVTPNVCPRIYRGLRRYRDDPKAASSRRTPKQGRLFWSAVTWHRFRSQVYFTGTLTDQQ